jgi:hypothetical protein
MGLLLLGLFIAVTIGLFFTPGIGLIAFVPLAFALAVAVWLVVARVKGVDPSEAVRETPKADLLGPGGPDDPTA